MKVKLKEIFPGVPFFYCVLYTVARAMLLDIFGSLANYCFVFCMLIFFCLYIIKYRSMRVKITKSKFWLSYILCLLSFVLNILMAPNATLYGLYEYVFYFLMIFSMLYVLNFVDFMRIMNIYEILGCVLAIEAIWEFSTGNILYRTSYEGMQLIRRAFGLIGSPITLGMIFAVVTLISIYFFIHYGKIHLFSAVINLVGLLCTQSRGPLVGLCIGCCVMLYLEQQSQGAHKCYSVLKTTFFIVLGLLCLWAIILYLKPKLAFVNTIYSRVLTIFQWGRSNATNFERKSRWLYALELFKQNPIFGYGISSTGVHSNSGIITESGVLKRLAETGIVGSVLIAILWFNELKGLFKKRGYYDRYRLQMVIPVLASIFVENIVMQVVESVSVYFILMLMAAFLIDRKSLKYEYIRGDNFEKNIYTSC